MINPELLHAHGHDAKHVLSFPTLRNCRDPSDFIEITDHFTCTSANVIYCINCTLRKKVYIGETERQLFDRFREHLRDVEKDDKNASKPVGRHFNLPNHSMQHMAVCGHSPHQGSTESRKKKKKKFITSHQPTFCHTHNPQFLDSLRRRANARVVSFRISLRWPIYILNETKLSCNTPK